MSVKKTLRDIYHKTYLRVFPRFPKEFGKSLVGINSLLDVGCGSHSPIRPFSKSFYSVGVDLYEPSIEKSKQDGIHNDYKKIDVLEIGNNFKPDSFDCVIALDVIEHLTKEEGYKLLDMMEKIARKKVIIYTPNGFIPQGADDGNLWQIHKSGWSTEDMKKRGYKVIGENGLQKIRKEIAPKVKDNLVIYLFLNFIADLTQIFIKYKPENSFQILCIKDK